MENKLNFFLIGKTGYGKSATGNTILNRRVFRTSSSATSETKQVQYCVAECEKHILLVVDGPGLEDTDVGIVEKKETEIKNLEIALAMSYEGVDAFLLVQKFPNKFTKEDQKVIDDLRCLFGEDYFNHVIVIITGGDLFQKEMADESEKITFDEWCKRQTGAFQKLYKDCSGRFVLFNNIETDKQKKQLQVQKVVQLAERLRDAHDRYTYKSFEQAKAEREKLIVQLKLPQLTVQIQEKICFLTADIETFLAYPTPPERERIERRIQELKDEIDVQDRDGVLNNLRQLVEQVRQNLHDKIKLKSLAQEMEEIRESRQFWKQIGYFVLDIIKEAAKFLVPRFLQK